jgi:hypothetical protein
LSDLAVQTALQQPQMDESAQPQIDVQALMEEWGPNFVDMPDTHVGILQHMARNAMDEDKFSRRVEIQTSKKAHWFWRSLQHIYWQGRAQGWVALGPNGSPLLDVNSLNRDEADSAVLYTTNIYQPYGLVIMAVLTQATPELIATPADADDPADVLTAKAGNNIKKIIEHENNALELLTKAVFFAYVDGRVHAWTRNEVDKDGNPKGRAPKISVYGSLYVKVPIAADCQEDMLYVQHSFERHVAFCKAENPKFASKIKGGAQGAGQDVYERTARISVALGTSYTAASGDSLINLSTNQMTWFDPAAFELEKGGENDENQALEELMAVFSEGCLVHLISGIYVGSRIEHHKDHWQIFHPLPGDGQFRNSVGHTTESVQERFNDIINIAQDTYEKTIPAGYFDAEMFDDESPVDQQSTPGARYFVNKEKGAPVEGQFAFEPPATVSPDMLQYGQLLMSQVPQFLTGGFEALFGGGEAQGAAGKTAAGYAMQRDQAMGRIGLIFRVMKVWWARVMGQATVCAAEREEDLQMSIPDKRGQLQTLKVELENLAGNVHWYAESDEGIPQNWTQKSNRLIAMLNNAEQNPLLAQFIGEPENLQLIRDYTGLEFKIPTADSADKQMLEINALLASTPVPNPAFAQAQQQFGQASQMHNAGMEVPPEQMMAMQKAAQEGPLSPSIQIDPQFDDHAAEFKTVKDWINDPLRGQKAKQENPQGFMNVRLHGLQHLQQLQQQMAQMAMMQPPPQAPQKPAAKAKPAPPA